MKRRQTLLILLIFAAAMALLEAAVVIYMRRLFYPENPLDLFPLTFLGSYDPILELARELSTIVMLGTVALLAERSSLNRSFAAFVFVFGVWDILYYAWLKALLGWPRELLEWDVLFLVPSIWLGPWICPALIALMFVVWGTPMLLSQSEHTLTKKGFLTFTIGAIGGLVTFLQPAVPIWWEGGTTNLMAYRPGNFWWWLFIPSYMVMAIGLGSCFWCEKTQGAASPKLDN